MSIFFVQVWRIRDLHYPVELFSQRICRLDGLCSAGLLGGEILLGGDIGVKVGAEVFSRLIYLQQFVGLAIELSYFFHLLRVIDFHLLEKRVLNVPLWVEIPFMLIQNR